MKTAAHISPALKLLLSLTLAAACVLGLSGCAAVDAVRAFIDSFHTKAPEPALPEEPDDTPLDTDEAGIPADYYLVGGFDLSRIRAADDVRQICIVSGHGKYDCHLVFAERTKDGWVCLDYIYQDGTTGSKTASGKITGNGLNIRSGPGTGYASVGSYNYGDSVTILEQFTYNGTTWGCTNQGWISMDYVSVGTTGTTTTSQTGTVIGNGLNVRNGAGTDYPTVASLNYGDRVTILEQKQVGDTTWGKISQGWISLDYVSLD
jgi:uncharacterized protein YraI